LTISNVTDYFAGNPISINNSRQFTYTNAPHIVSVTPLNHETAGHYVEVEFSEDVGAATAEVIGNYSIDNGVSISLAQLAANRNDGTDLRRVHLQTSTLTEGTTYQLTVNNVSDTFGNPIAAASVFNFDKDQDLTPPQAFTGHVSNPRLDRNKVYVVFSEDMNSLTAGDMANYSIDQGVTISSASFGADGKTVTLTTSQHDGGDYQVTVGTVQDDSVAGNSTTTTILDYWVNDLADFNFDTNLDSLDIGVLMSAWGQAITPAGDEPDLDGNGTAGSGDLADWLSRAGL
jgi:hypothetical protein